ncbi:hypothetical protein ACFX12_039769 [Malus domestica]
MIDLTSSKGKKEADGSEPVKPAIPKLAEDEPVKSATPKVAKMIADRIAQCRRSVVPSVSGAKSDLTSGRLAAMKSGNKDSASRVVLGPVPSAIGINLLLRRRSLLMRAIMRDPPSLALESLLRFVCY